MIERRRFDPKTKSKTKAVTPAATPRSTLFGQPQLLEGEDAAAYHQLLARIFLRYSRPILSMRCSSPMWFTWSGRCCGGVA